MKKIFFLIIIVLVVACKNEDAGSLMKVSTVPQGYIISNVAITADTEFVIKPDYAADKWVVHLLWNSSTAGTSSETVVTIREGLNENRMQYYASTDTLTVDTATGSKYWKGTDFCSDYLGIKIGTFSGTTTKFSIYYSTK